MALSFHGFIDFSGNIHAGWRRWSVQSVFIQMSWLFLRTRFSRVCWGASACSDGVQILHQTLQVGHFFWEFIGLIRLREREPCQTSHVRVRIEGCKKSEGERTTNQTERGKARGARGREMGLEQLRSERIKQDATAQPTTKQNKTHAFQKRNTN